MVGCQVRGRRCSTACHRQRGGRLILGVLKCRAVELEIAGCVTVCGGIDQGRGRGQKANVRLMAYEGGRRDSSSSSKYQISKEKSM